MGRKKVVVENKVIETTVSEMAALNTELAEKELINTLNRCFCIYENYSGYQDISVEAGSLVNSLRDVVKCWVKDAIREMKEEDTNTN